MRDGIAAAPPRTGGLQSAVPKRAVWKPPLLVYALARLVVGG